MSWSFSRWLGVHVVEDFQMAGCARDLVRVHVGAGGGVGGGVQVGGCRWVGAGVCLRVSDYIGGL